MNPVSYDIAAYLQDVALLGTVAQETEPDFSITVDDGGSGSGSGSGSGTGGTGVVPGSDWGIYVNRLPDKPVHCIAIFEAPSPSPVTPLNAAETGSNPFETVYFQVQVRAATDPACWNKILAIAKALNGLKQYLVTEAEQAAVKYSSVTRRSDFLPLMAGEKDLFLRSTNFAVMRQELLPES